MNIIIVLLFVIVSRNFRKCEWWRVQIYVKKSVKKPFRDKSNNFCPENSLHPSTAATAQAFKETMPPISLNSFRLLQAVDKNTELSLCAIKSIPETGPRKYGKGITPKNQPRKRKLEQRKWRGKLIWWKNENTRQPRGTKIIRENETKNRHGFSEEEKNCFCLVILNVISIVALSTNGYSLSTMVAWKLGKWRNAIYLS